MCLAFGLLVFGIVFLGVVAVRVMTNDDCSKEKPRRNAFTKNGLLLLAASGYLLSTIVVSLRFIITLISQVPV